MNKISPTTFRLPSKYLVFLEMLAQENNSDRSKELIKILDAALQHHLNCQPTASSRRSGVCR